MFEKLDELSVIECDGRIVRSDAAFALRDSITSQVDARVIVLDLSEVNALEGGGLGMLMFCNDGLGLSIFNSSCSTREARCERDSSAPSRPRVLRSSVSKKFCISSGKLSMAEVWLRKVKNDEKTLREHIESLEQKLQVLTARLMDEEPGKIKAGAELESELRAVECALMVDRSAFEIEQRL